MPAQVMLGKKPARPDSRIPRMSRRLTNPGLIPPPHVNWYKEIGSAQSTDWGMMANDEVGDCVVATIGHCIEAFTKLADGASVVMSKQEAITAYSDIGGYVPGDPNTDQGLYMLGKGGAIEHWAQNGIVAGGMLHTVDGFLQLKAGNSLEWMQGIWLFGGMMVGLQLPENVVAPDVVPFIWDNPTGPIAGGHEVWVCGYEPATSTTPVVFDTISWGKRYRMTLPFMLACVDEAVVVFNEDEFNARGFTAGHLSKAQLIADMSALSKE